MTKMIRPISASTNAPHMSLKAQAWLKCHECVDTNGRIWKPMCSFIRGVILANATCLG